MTRVRLLLTCLAIAGALNAAGCDPKTSRRISTSTKEVSKQVSSATDKLADDIAPAWDMTVTAATSLDAARNGCDIHERKPFEFSGTEEYYLGHVLAAEHIADIGATDIGPNHPVSRYVDRIGQFLALAAQAYGEQNKRERWKDYPEKVVPNRPYPYGGYHFIVLNRREPNAFGGPGGAILITTGLLAQLQNEDELASVLAHEIAHVQRGHGVEFLKAFMCQRAAQNKAYEPARRVAANAKAASQILPEGSMLKGLTDELLDDMLNAVSDQAKALYEVGYPRGFEYEADRIALRYMELAGYDVEAMGAVFKRLDDASKGGKDAYGVTHPRFEKRLRVIKPVVTSVKKDVRTTPAQIAMREARFRSVMLGLPALPPEPPAQPPAEPPAPSKKTAEK